MSATSLALYSQDFEGAAFFGSRLVFAVRGMGLGAVGGSVCGAGPLAGLASAQERLVVRLPPWAALLAFGVPVLALIPIKLLAVYLLGQGHLATGVGLILLAKLGGTALATRLFQLTQPCAHADSMVCQNLRALENLERPQAAAGTQLFALALGPQAQASGEIAGDSPDDGLQIGFLRIERITG